MIILAASAPAGFDERYAGHELVGHLLTPACSLRRIRRALESGLPWAVDYKDVRGVAKWEEYWSFLDILGGGKRLVPPCHHGFNRGSCGCRFVACTRSNLEVGDRFRELGLPPAFVTTPEYLDWALKWKGWGIVLDGTADWKKSWAVRQVVAQARVLGKWVHAADVDSYKLAVHMARIGCCSASTPHYARFKHGNFRALLKAAEQVAGERVLFGHDQRPAEQVGPPPPGPPAT